MTSNLDLVEVEGEVARNGAVQPGLQVGGPVLQSNKNVDKKKVLPKARSKFYSTLTTVSSTHLKREVV